MTTKICRFTSILSSLRKCHQNFNILAFSQRCDFHNTQPAEGKMKFIQMGIDTEKYTMKPLKCPKTGGRGYKGKVQVKGVGGGKKNHYRMVDFKRIRPTDGPSIAEKVISIQYDPKRTGHIAVVAGGEKKRFILASQNMKPGDVITSTSVIPRMAVLAYEGNAHPVGALPMGTLIHNLEEYAGEGGKLIRAGGTTGQLMRKVGNMCVVKLPSGNEITVPENCMATVGQVSNVNQNLKKMKTAGQARWAGVRPSSGLYQKKTGQAGRKIKPMYNAVKKVVRPPSGKFSKRFTFD